MTWKSFYTLSLCLLLLAVGNPILAQIIVDFTADITEGCSSAQVQFSDKSESSGGNIVSWSWDLGGANSELENPGKIFANVGNTSICLTVTDESGNSKTLCKDDFIKIYDLPVADFTADLLNGCAPLFVRYEDLSHSSNGEIIKWTWGLNGSNGIIETTDSERPIFTEYTSSDIYTISLAITDVKGCSNAITKGNFIDVEKKPEIKIATTEPIGCAFPMTVDFVNLGHVDGIEYFWDFGNGETFTGFDPSPISYDSEAAYDIEIIAVNSLTGCSDTLILQDYINSGGTILFDFYPKSICMRGSVQFEDLSPIEADVLEWDFGDGQTSSERDPSHTYQNAGNYIVSLKRKTAECEGTQFSQFHVEVQENPTLDYEIDIENDCKLPARVNFSANGTEEGLYRWYIGKQGDFETILTGQSDSYTFDKFGSYEVRLLMDNELGCRSVALIDTIAIEPFKARITGKTEGCIPFTANMGIGSNSSVPISDIQWKISGSQEITSSQSFLSVDIEELSNFDLEVAVENELGCVDTIRGDDILRGGIQPTADFALSDDEICPREVISFNDLSTANADTWNWTFNDSIFSYEQSPEMTFNSPGDYTVTLEVGNNGCFTSITKDSLFYVNFPGVSFDVEYQCDNPYAIKALNKSSDFDSLIWSYSIGTDTFKLPFEDSLEINFPENASYVLSLQAFNYENGCDNTVSDTILISDPEARFTMSQFEGCAPLDIIFTDDSEDAISWKYFTEVGAFNDDTLPDPTIRIHHPGEYDDIGLIVTDIHGCQDTTFSPIIKVNKVLATFSTPDPVCINDTLFIDQSSTSLFSNISSLSWTLGDNLDTSTFDNAGFVLDQIGKHDIKLLAIDEWGCRDSITTGLAAYFRAPNFELAADSLSCTTHELKFRNILHANNYTYQWNFGDGDSSILANPSHLYDTEGNYNVTIRLEDDEACVNEIKLDHLIKIADPIASFAADSTFAACPPLITTFANESQHGTNFIWNFGDESGISSEFDPAHLYVKAGVFDVELIVVRSPYCQDTMLLNDLIHLDGPKGEFTFEVDSSCVPLKVSFQAELAEDYSLIWDYGDGNLQAIEEKTNFSIVDYIYEQPGDFTPKIILEDSENCKITREGESIQTHALEANFHAFDSIFCNDIPQSIVLNDASYSTSPIISHNWIVGNDSYEVESPEFSVSDTGRFDVQLVVSNIYCADTLVKENYINVGEAPILTKMQDTFNCISTDFNLAVSSEGENDQYIWYSESGEAISFGDSLYNEILDVGQFFIVQAVNEYKCLASDTINVEIIDDRTLFAGPDKTICFGDEVEIDISYGSNVQWLTGQQCINCKVLNLAPDSLTYYTLEVTNEYGCIVRDTLSVDVLYQDDIEAGDNQFICKTERPVLLAFTEGDVKWSPSILVDDATAYLTTANIQESTMFYLESTLDECTLRDSVFVEILDKANLKVTGDTICYGDMAQVIAGGDIDDVRWETEGPLLSDLNIMNPTSRTTTSTQFMAIGSLGGCIPDTAYANVMVYPEIKGHLPETRNYFVGTEEVQVDVQMTSTGDYTYTWIPDDMVNCGTCPSVMVKTADTTHKVSVEIMERESGCSDTLSIVIRQYYGCESATTDIGVPNIFSPNEDGVNDVLNIDSPTFDDIESVAIFDRWGQKVFFTSNVDDYWDGRHSGVPVQNGVYSYLIKAKCPDTGLLVTAVGDVTVIR